MVHVAVAGGTSQGLAFSIVSALAQRCHQVTVLSRSSNVPEHLVPLGSKITVKAVDYTSIPSLESALNGVHTVISTLGDPSTLVPNQLNLLEASKKAGVKRFAPSEFSAPKMNEVIDLYAPKVKVWEACEKSGLEVASIHSGLFMNYICSGYDNSALGGLKPVKIAVDTEKWTATIPGDGSARLSFTRIEDVGKFVAVAVELDNWDEKFYTMAGHTTTYLEIVKLLEEAEGKKMEVKFIPLSEYTPEKRPEDMWARFAFDYQKSFAEGMGDFGDHPNLNKAAEGKIEGVMDTKAFIAKWFGKK